MATSAIEPWFARARYTPSSRLQGVVPLDGRARREMRARYACDLVMNIRVSTVHDRTACSGARANECMGDVLCGLKMPMACASMQRSRPVSAGRTEADVALTCTTVCLHGLKGCVMSTLCKEVARSARGHEEGACPRALTCSPSCLLRGCQQAPGDDTRTAPPLLLRHVFSQDSSGASVDVWVDPAVVRGPGAGATRAGKRACSGPRGLQFL
jgi:hypothetical protein